MSKYKVGDVVKLRDDLEVGEKYGEKELNEAMNVAIGKKAEIKACYNGEYYAKFASRYGGCWFIADEMIEGLWEECKSSEQVSKSEDKLKLIDVLNMIANGELKQNTQIIWNDTEYILRDGIFLRYIDFPNARIFLLEDMAEKYRKDSEWLNDEVELIEPPCEHEWLDWETRRMGEGRIRRYRRCNKCGLEEETEDNHFADVGKMAEPTKIEELKYDVTDLDCLGIHNKTISINIADKLNEVIRMVNAITSLLN